MRALAIAVTAALMIPGAAQAQATPPAAAAPVSVPEAGESIDSLITELYAVISGPAGPRDWARFSLLFVNEGRLVPVGERGPRILTPQTYSERAGATMNREGFFESEIARRTERFGNVAHVFSTYESRHTPNGAPFARGINSIQLVRVDGQWRILSIMWQGETAQYPIPAPYLTSTPAK